MATHLCRASAQVGSNRTSPSRLPANPSFQNGSMCAGPRPRVVGIHRRAGRSLRGRVSAGVDLSEHTLNVNLAVDKAHESLSFSEISALPVDALQGIAERGADALKKIGVRTVADMGNSKYYKWAKALSVLAEREEDGKRSPEAAMHVNSAVVKEFESKSLKEIAAAPVWALQGISPRMAEDLGAVQIRTVRDFGTNKYAAWSEAVVTLAALESK